MQANVVYPSWKYISGVCKWNEGNKLTRLADEILSKTGYQYDVIVWTTVAQPRQVVWCHRLLTSSYQLNVNGYSSCANISTTKISKMKWSQCKHIIFMPFKMAWTCEGYHRSPYDEICTSGEGFEHISTIIKSISSSVYKWWYDLITCWYGGTRNRSQDCAKRNLICPYKWYTFYRQPVVLLFCVPETTSTNRVLLPFR